MASSAVDKWETRIKDAERQLSDAKAHLEAARQLREQAAGRVGEIGALIAQATSKELPPVQATPDLEQKFNSAYKRMFDLQQAAWEAHRQRRTAQLPREKQEVELQTARLDTQFTEAALQDFQKELQTLLSPPQQQVARKRPAEQDIIELDAAQQAEAEQAIANAARVRGAAEARLDLYLDVHD